MACEQFEPHILDYLENQLPPGERARVAAHLAACADCRAFARQLRELDTRLTRTLKVPTLSPSFNAELRRRIQITHVMSEAEIAERKRQLQAEYEAGLARITVFPRLPRKYFELLGIAAMLGLAGWLTWLMWPRSAMEAGISGLSAASQHLLVLTAVSVVPVAIGLLLAFPARYGQSWSWHPAGGSFSSATVR